MDAKQKMCDNRGMAAIFVVLIIAILIMLAITVIPMVLESDAHTREKLDSDHEVTARDSALLRVNAVGGFTAAYDYYNKCFVVGSEAKNVEAYGESDEHKGKIILVEATADGKVTLTWVFPREVPHD